MTKKTRSLGAVVCAMILSACGGGTTETGTNGDTTVNPNTSTIPKCKVDGNTVLVPTNGKCTYGNEILNDGEELTYSCDGEKVTNGIITSKTITLNDITITCE